MACCCVSVLCGLVFITEISIYVFVSIFELAYLLVNSNPPFQFSTLCTVLLPISPKSQQFSLISKMYINARFSLFLALS